MQNVYLNVINSPSGWVSLANNPSRGSVEMMKMIGLIPLVDQLSIVNDMKYYLLCSFLKSLIYLPKKMFMIPKLHPPITSQV